MPSSKPGRLLHYSTHPIEQVYSVEQGGEYARGDKPHGLWVSVEGKDDWASWCKAEDFSDLSTQHCYEVVLRPRAPVLLLATTGALLSFTEDFGDPKSAWMLDWPRVAKQYAGIIIAPYQWSLRLDPRTNWYYGYDCASGCLWDATAISELRLVYSPAEVRAG